MATDTAFAIALIRHDRAAGVLVELRVFLTAAAIIDDIGAVIVVAFFYPGETHAGGLIADLGVAGCLAILNQLENLCAHAVRHIGDRPVGGCIRGRAAPDSGGCGAHDVHTDAAAPS